MSDPAMPEEGTAWTQTFVTVTPQDDGFLREIEESVVVSGSGDTPMHLDTWNIVLRRSLVDTTENWVDATGAEQSERVATECQTYLQGVPEVELPRVYRDEATQTLYIGRDGQAATIPLNYFDDIIAVLNKKSLPELKTSRTVQTIVTMKSSVSENEIIRMLDENEDEMMANDSQSSIGTSEKENIFSEASDIVNYIVDRTLWMTNDSDSPPKREKNDAEVQTSIKYNHRTKKVTVDYEIQTNLTCDPKYSNSMLLADYNETKNFCRARVDECIEKGIYPRIVVENIVEEIMTKCKRQTDFPFQENKIGSSDDKVSQSHKCDENHLPIRSKCSCRVISEVQRITQPVRDALVAGNGYHFEGRRANVQRCTDANLESSSSSSRSSSRSSESSKYTSSSRSSWRTSSSERSLTYRDKQALGTLRNAFCGSQYKR